MTFLISILGINIVQQTIFNVYGSGVWFQNCSNWWVLILYNVHISTGYEYIILQVVVFPIYLARLGTIFCPS